MNNQTPISPEELFKRQFQEYETEFDGQAWDHMRALLDEEDGKRPAVLLPDQKNEPISKRTLTFKIIITMIAISLISLVTWWSLGNSEMKENAAAHPAGETITRTETAKSPAGRQHTSSGSLADNQATAGYNAFASTPGKESNSKTPAAKTEASVGTSLKAGKTASGTAGLSIGNTLAAGKTGNGQARKPEGAANGGKTANKAGNLASSGTGQKTVEAGKTLLNEATAPADTPKTNQPLKYKKVVVRKVWVPDEYEYISLPREKTIQDFWIGIHYTMQEAHFDVPGQDSATNTGSGSTRKSQGFNIQFMSGNLMGSKYWGAYGGFDWGMQFYGRTPNHPVELNTTNGDSGYTRLRMNSMDFLARGHWEYARYAIVPYFNLMAGPRLYMTNQKVASYLPLKNNESSNTENVHTSASLLYGGAIGARVKVGRAISLDARYELIYGTQVKLVDIDNSTFNGLSYNLKTYQVNPVHSQFKVGVIFDLSSSKSKTRLKTPGHYREEVYDSVQVDPKDSNVRYLPCPPCNCDEKKDSYQYNRKPSTEPVPQGDIPKENKNNTPVITPNPTPSPSPGSGGKSSFPGIKTPTPKPVPR